MTDPRDQRRRDVDTKRWFPFALAAAVLIVIAAYATSPNKPAHNPAARSSDVPQTVDTLPPKR
jgi:hypothetical protein